MKFTILVDPFLVIITTYYLFCLINAWESREKNPCPGGHEIYNFLLTLPCSSLLHTNRKEDIKRNNAF